MTAHRQDADPGEAALAASPEGAAIGRYDPVERVLQSASCGWLTRWDAAEEIVRILAAREREWPALIAAGKIDAALAADRTARLACCWSYTVEPGLEWTGPHRYRDDVERARWMAEALGWKPSTLSKGR